MGNIKINSRPTSFEPGQTLLAVCESAGADVPTLCFLKGASPNAACGVCVVEDLTSGDLLKACETPAREGMDIRTRSFRVNRARKTAIRRLVASGNHNCGVASALGTGFTDLQVLSESIESGQTLCPAWGNCELQDLAYEYQVRVSAYDSGWEKEMPERVNPMIVRDFSRCIGCGKCVAACNEIQGTRCRNSSGLCWAPTISIIAPEPDMPQRSQVLRPHSDPAP